jgi:hypothetical protein
MCVCVFVCVQTCSAAGSVFVFGLVYKCAGEEKKVHGGRRSGSDQKAVEGGRRQDAHRSQPARPPPGRARATTAWGVEEE